MSPTEPNDHDKKLSSSKVVKAAVPKLTQLTLWKQPLASSPTKTVQVKKHINKNGTIVQSHTRTIQIKQKKAQPKLRSGTKKASKQELVVQSKQTSNYFPHSSAFENIDEKTKNGTMSELIDDLHNKVKGNSNNN